MDTDIEHFRKQIKEDIDFIKDNYLNLDSKFKKDEYAFNFWIQTKMYEIEEELAVNSITEYNDKGIDCFVSYPETKELFLIQNKYYSKDTNLDVKEVGHFLTTSLSKLAEGNYKNDELQSIYNTAKEDSYYKIWLHFYITNDKLSQDAINNINEFNKSHRNVNCEIRAKIFSLKDIYTLYYGASFDKKVQFKYTLSTVNRQTLFRILPKEYGLSEMSESYYIMTPIETIYEMNKKANEKKYPLFEENIREYMGKSYINNGIIKTLQDENERKNFFYYNNGITVICDKSNTVSVNSIELVHPQIVNGCQTVSTIDAVLSSYSKEEIKKTFEGVYVMVKVLIQTNQKSDFYKKVVRFTNSQNAINEKAFASSVEYFLNVQDHFKERGFLLLVKPSDKHTFSELSAVERNKLIAKAQKLTKNLGLNLKTISDIQIPLDKILQVLLAFVKDGHYAYTQKTRVLKQNNEIYETISRKMLDHLGLDNLIYLYLLYKKAETDKKASNDKKTPIPYYLISFISYFMETKNNNTLNSVLESLSNKRQEEFNSIYGYFKDLTFQYKEESSLEYNQMVKTKIDEALLSKQIETLNRLSPYKLGKDFINTINKISLLT
jgi:hypothetical protein